MHVTEPGARELRRDGSGAPAWRRARSVDEGPGDDDLMTGFMPASLADPGSGEISLASQNYWFSGDLAGARGVTGGASLAAGCVLAWYVLRSFLNATSRRSVATIRR